LAGFGTLSGSIDPSVLDGTTRLASGTSVKLSLPPGTAYTGPAPYAIINLNTNFQLNANSNGNNYAINYNLTSTNNQTLMAFKVGDGGQAYNNITAYFASINKDALGLTNADISTKSSADGAAAAIVSALDVITSARTYMGAIQNRLQVAGENQRVALENINTAVSSYLDVDVAAEMTKMTSTQMLRTIGVSMTSQANQSGQTLVKLLE
jgi:flagellin